MGLTLLARGELAGLHPPGTRRIGAFRGGLGFLLLIDPVFTLHFPDDSTLLVEAVADGERLVLTARDR
ncbi:hypothetical protein CFP65_1871 [Kitasatospora sp. MMS16-BH015]|nr:hypothetical protein CFP65_1871 [Kitasatospora sp. MMS16-BH015]